MTYGSDSSSLVEALHMSESAASPELEEVAAIVQRVLNGDSSAFEQLVARYERRVMTVSMRILGVREDAHDAAQEVFLRVFKYLHRLDTGKPIEPWLIRTTVNVCRDISRKTLHHRDACPSPEDFDFLSNRTRDPHAELAEEQQRELLWNALNELSENERLAIILRDVEGLSTPEVAGILDSAESTVRSLISRGRLKLKESIDRKMGGLL